MFSRGLSLFTKTPFRIGVSAAVVSSFAFSQATTFCESPFSATETSPKEFRRFEVAAHEPITHDSNLVIIEVADQKKLPVSSFMLLKVPGCNNDAGEPVVRPYTPLDSNVKDGKMVFAVKGYPNGNLSKCISELQAGDAIDIKGPLKKFDYQANQNKNMVFMAGGSGVTPMIQIILEILSNPDDKTQMTLVLADHKQEDIMLVNLLSHLSTSEQLTVHHVLATPQPNWKGQTGRISQEIAENLIPPATNDTFVCVCGPPGFYDTVSGPKGKKSQGEVGGILKNMGFTSQQVYKL